jgi:hypothetical protein
MIRYEVIFDCERIKINGHVWVMSEVNRRVIYFPSLCTVEAKTRKCCLSNFETRFNRFSGWLLSGRETTLISGFLVNYTKLSNSRFEAIWNGYSTTFYICSWQSPFVHSHAVLLTVTELATSLLMKIFVFGINVENTEQRFPHTFLKNFQFLVTYWLFVKKSLMFPSNVVAFYRIFLHIIISLVSYTYILPYSCKFSRTVCAEGSLWGQFGSAGCCQSINNVIYCICNILPSPVLWWWIVNKFSTSLFSFVINIHSHFRM